MGQELQGTVKVDDKHRVVLSKELREATGIGDRKELVAIPFWGGVTLASPRGKSFAESLSGFNFVEEKHEADKFLMEAAGIANSGHSGNRRRRR